MTKEKDLLTNDLDLEKLREESESWKEVAYWLKDILRIKEEYSMETIRIIDDYEKMLDIAIKKWDEATDERSEIASEKKDLKQKVENLRDQVQDLQNQPEISQLNDPAEKYNLYATLYRDHDMTWPETHEFLRIYITVNYSGVSERTIDKYVNKDFKKFHDAFTKYKRENPDLVK